MDIKDVFVLLLTWTSMYNFRDASTGEFKYELKEHALGVMSVDTHGSSNGRQHLQYG